MAGERERIGGKALEAIEARGTHVVVSAVNIWEVAIKRRLGELDAPADLLDRLGQARVDLLPINARHADRVGTLPCTTEIPSTACSWRRPKSRA